jgi:hypothetical protein
MFRTFVAAVALAVTSLGLAAPSHAEEQATTPAAAQNRLMIVNGNSGHVIYDDRRPDLYCVTRRFVAGYTYEGRPIFRRTMHCR